VPIVPLLIATAAARNGNTEWLTRPGSQQLGAKWVDVNGGVRGRQSRLERIENVASNTR